MGLRHPVHEHTMEARLDICLESSLADSQSWLLPTERHDSRSLSFTWCTKWTHCNTLQHTATHCNTLQHSVEVFLSHDAMRLSPVRHDSISPSSTSCPHCMQHTATHCNTLQHTATHCNTLQHTESAPLPPHAMRPSLVRHDTICLSLARHDSRSLSFTTDSICLSLVRHDSICKSMSVYVSLCQSDTCQYMSVYVSLCQSDTCQSDTWWYLSVWHVIVSVYP